MSDFFEQASKKLQEKVSGNKEAAMAPLVSQTLLDFCQQEPEFAQAVAQGGSFPDCMKEVAKGVSGAISDIDAYKKAVAFYFPTAKIRVRMRIDLIGSSAEDIPTPDTQTRSASGRKSIVLNLEDFL